MQKKHFASLPLYAHARVRSPEYVHDEGHGDDLVYDHDDVSGHHEREPNDYGTRDACRETEHGDHKTASASHVCGRAHHACDHEDRADQQAFQIPKEQDGNVYGYGDTRTVRYENGHEE